MEDDENTLVIEIDLDSGKVKGDLNRLVKTTKTQGKKVGQNFERGFRGLNRGISSIRGRIIALGATLLATFGARKVIQASARQEAAVNSLNAALQQTGKFTPQASRSLQNFASQLQQTTRFGDEFILENAALIQSLGKLSNEGLKQATAAAADLAEGLGIDLRTASNLVGRAATGNIALFSRYGITIQRGADNAETFANAIRSINQSFGGRAAREVQTYRGVTEQLSNAFGDVLEILGDAFTQSPLVVKAFSAVKDIFVEVGQSLRNSFNPNTIANFVLSITPILESLNAVFVRPFEVLFNVSTLIFNSIVTGFNLLIRNISSGVSGLASILPNALVSDETKQALQTFAESSSEVFVESANKTNEAIGQVFDQTVSNNIANGINKLNELARASLSAETNIGKSSKGVNQNIEQVSDTITNQVDAINKTINQGLVNGLSNGVGALGASLVTGENAFKAFSGSILATLGDTAQSIGKIIIAEALAFDALKKTLTSILSFGPGVAIAAGFGLIALGGAVKAIGAQLGGSQGSSSASSVATPTLSSGTSAPIQDETDELETQEPDEIINEGPSVVVNVDTLVENDSGSRIVELINDAFDTKGTVINRRAIA